MVDHHKELTSLIFSLLILLLFCRLGHPDIFGLIRKQELYNASLLHLKELLDLDEMVGAHTL